MAGRRASLRLAYSAGRRTTRLRCTRTFGLTANELRAEMRRLTSHGWQLAEIAYRFGCNCKDTE